MCKIIGNLNNNLKNKISIICYIERKPAYGQAAVNSISLKVSDNWMKHFKKKVWIILGAAVIFVCILAVWAVTGYFSACSRNTRRLERTLAAAPGEGAGEVAKLLELDYDALYVFGPYESVASMEKKLGFGFELLKEGSSDNCMNYLFIKNGKPAAYLFGLPEETGYCINLEPGKYMSGDVQGMSYEAAVRKAGSTAEEEREYTDYNFYYKDEICREDETEVVVEQSGQAVMEAPVGEEISVDLDGGGLDSVLYSLRQSVSGNGGASSYEVAEFLINGKNYINNLKDMGVALDAPEQVYYYIIDLSASDDFREIALLNGGEYPATYFFRYNKGRLSFIGSISDFPQSDTCHFQNEGKGKGEIIASFRLSILQEWSAEGYWKLNESDRLTFQPQSVYYLNNPYEAKLLCELAVYRERDRNGAAQMLEPGEVMLSATDNKNWVQIEDTKGNQGWFYVEDYDTISDTGRKAGEVFSGLTSKEVS